MTAAAFVIGTAVGALAWLGPEWAKRVGIGTTTAQPVWNEVAGHSPSTNGKGKALRCNAANCGTEVNVYIRAKIGFRNCTTGVANGNELLGL